MNNNIDLKKFSDQRTWVLVCLSIITWFVYVAYYISRKTKIINQFVTKEDAISKYFTWFVFFISYLSLVFFISYLFVEEGHVIEKISTKVDTICSITILVWSFKARNRMNKILEVNVADKEWFHGVWTFLFWVFYFNYKVNKLSKVTLHEAPSNDSTDVDPIS